MMKNSSAPGSGKAVPIAEVPVAKPSDKSVSFALMGDTSLGDVYLRKPGLDDAAQRLRDDPWSFFAPLLPLVAEADFRILNLETVLAENPCDPFEGTKRYQGWDNPERMLSMLERLGIDCVSLANNHALDFGSAPFLATLEALTARGIKVFGAGRSLDSALMPLSFGGPRGKVYVFAGFEHRSRYDGYGFYAGYGSPGTAPLLHDGGQDVVGAVAKLRASEPDALILAFPHWSGSRNYRWVTRSMVRMNESLLAAGVDLVIGHGAHMLQEIVARAAGSTIFSLGNFVFNSPGRYESNTAPGYSLIARLDLDVSGGSISGDCRLYPIASDNRKTGFRPRPVTGEEIVALYRLILSRKLCANLASRFRVIRDSRGYAFQLLGDLSPRIMGPLPQ